MTNLRILGIDPGLEGGLAVIEAGEVPVLIACIDIPLIGTLAKVRVDVQAIASFIAQYQPRRAVIERAGVMPKQGNASGFKYGRAVGALEAVLALGQLPYEIIEPATWKRIFHLKGGDKEGARQLAIQMFPAGQDWMKLKKHHGRAEACLLALYSYKQHVRS